jgi:hypothetical protein
MVPLGAADRTESGPVPQAEYYEVAKRKEIIPEKIMLG